jgi:hypothetical protein
MNCSAREDGGLEDWGGFVIPETTRMGQDTTSTLPLGQIPRKTAPEGWVKTLGTEYFVDNGVIKLFPAVLHTRYRYSV